MDDLKKSLTIKEIKTAPNLETPKFNIRYGTNNPVLKDWKGYRIISALKKDDNIILELNSSLLNLPINQRSDTAMAFIDELKIMKLDYRYRKITANQSGGILEQLLNFGKKNDTAHQIFVDLPNEVWNDEKTVVSLIPPYGARFFIHPRPNSEVLEPLFNGYYTDEDILNSFKLVCYDCPSFGQMGIYTKSLKLADMQSLLGM